MFLKAVLLRQTSEQQASWPIPVWSLRLRSLEISLLTTGYPQWINGFCKFKSYGHFWVLIYLIVISRYSDIKRPDIGQFVTWLISKQILCGFRTNNRYLAVRCWHRCWQPWSVRMHQVGSIKVQGTPKISRVAECPKRLPGWKSWKTGPFDRGLLTSTWER